MSDPKAKAAIDRPPMWLLPYSGMVAQAEAHLAGYMQYGAFNWRRNQIDLIQYTSAIVRHAKKLEEGEWRDVKDQITHAGAIMASGAILIDSHLHGTLVDCGPRSGLDQDALIYAPVREYAFTKHVLEGLYAGCTPEHCQRNKGGNNER